MVYIFYNFILRAYITLYFNLLICATIFETIYK